MMIKTLAPSIRFSTRSRVVGFPGNRLIFTNQRGYSTSTNIEEQSNESSEQNTEQSTEQQVAATQETNQAPSTKIASSSKALKKRICLDSTNISDTAFTSSNLNNTLTKQYFKHIQLPSVASTQYLDTGSLKTDIFYKGFRPLLSPIKRPIVRNSKKPTIPLSWNTSACKLKNFDDYSKVPQFVVDKLTPFNQPPSPGNEIRLGNKSRKELRQQERLSKQVLEFINHFKK